MKRFFSMNMLLLLIISIFAQAPNGYYSTAHGKNKGELKTALSNICKGGTRLSYGSGSTSTWGGFYTTDRNDDNSVGDMYSDEVRYFNSKGSTISGMNIEHGVAKSWWGGTNNDAYKDLYHLGPSDISANSAKSNYPPGINDGSSFDNGAIKIGYNSYTGSQYVMCFEPKDEYKGDFARMYFYMITAYESLNWNRIEIENNQYPQFTSWLVNLLLEWHRLDPVSERELKRIEEVYAIQENRNPYIDYPELIEYVWGDLKDEEWQYEGGGVVNPDPDQPGCTPKTWSESFTWSLGDCEIYSTTGDQTWRYDSKYGAVISGYQSNVAYVNEDWLITPSLDLSESKNGTFSFEHAINFAGDMSNDETLWISDNYTTGDPNLASWEQLIITQYPAGNNWSFVKSGNIIIPEKYHIENIRLAFKYISSDTNAGTWEVKNLSLKSDCIITSAKNIQTNNNIRIFTKGEYLYVEGVKDNTNIEIFSTTGQLIHSTHIYNGMTRIPALNSGVYILKAGNSIEKFIMQ